MPVPAVGIFLAGLGGAAPAGGPSSASLQRNEIGFGMTNEQWDQLDELEARVSELRGYL
jgi:hypothetical protein